MCPASKAYCPLGRDETNILIEDKTKEYSKEFYWPITVPNLSALDYHCKYMIQTARSIVMKSGGYTFLQIEQYGFDEEVTLIV